jgi:hypothetical protein
LLRGFSVARGGVRPNYDISPDGRLVVVESRDPEGKHRLSVAPLDRRSPPRQIPNAEGDGPLFGPGGEIFFRGREGDYGFPYRVREDGTELRKVSDYPVSGIMGVSRDGQWLAVYARPSEMDREAGATLALPLQGGSPVLIYGQLIFVKWSWDGKFLFLSVPKSFYSGETGNTYVLALPRGRALPEIPKAGFPSEEAIAKLPGVRVIDSWDVAPGPDAEVFAFSRVTVQRNLYRMPVP